VQLERTMLSQVECGLRNADAVMWKEYCSLWLLWEYRKNAEPSGMRAEEC
jgi:hypothetical protein